ncbi:TraR/DksA C4-type zinc finger protein [Polaromonas sp. P1-6]|nr:TraR/DksA C4-type zinc finger protein [Polaromonas sp. P1-6]
MQDPGEDAEERFRHGLEHVDLQRDQEELRAIQQAQERMADSSYGSCIDCGQPIPFERLKAQPSASRCIACQTLRTTARHNAALGGLTRHETSRFRQTARPIRPPWVP